MKNINIDLASASPIKSSWNIHIQVGDAPLGHEYLNKLINGDISLIVIKGLLSSQTLTTIKKNIIACQERIVQKQYVNGTLTTFGPYLAKHLNTLEDYFAQANDTDQVFDGTDIREDIRKHLCKIFSIQDLAVAQEADGRAYAPGVVRIHADGVSNPLHNDNVMRDTAHTPLILKNLITQLSCIVCLQECDQGGELKHYAKKWSCNDETYKIPGGLGYDVAVVNNIDNIVFKPEMGDIYIINPTFYHEIAKVAGNERITLGFFIGFFDEAMLQGVVWS